MNEHEFKKLLASIKQAKKNQGLGNKGSPVFRYEPLKVRAIREKLNLTQAKFADMLRVSLATIRNWEQGRTYPEGAAIALLRVADAKPEAVLEALHVI